ncbi:peptidase M50 [Duganella sp. Leaf126]|uniref:site-2 protease family protein n=1 Tax=Duganella sp. Leaf126 TaxID=1736266 RepID=UPI0006F827CA|nr:site-2 protease family protein [Duganella sp. Leaf126]KQQ33341.1 peptidase M50 [Duganella sp. Leaf126]
MDIDTIIRTATVYAIPVLFAISLHEAAHGYVARYFGDSTAADQGRLSVNPARHIDLFGTILLPLMLALMKFPPLGYAKPVPVAYERLRNPRKHMAFVAAAGPGANFAMGLGWMALWVIFIYLLHLDQDDFFVLMARAGIGVNSAMLVFNLIPLPPLDGGRIVTGLLPLPLARRYAQIERFSMLVFIALVLMLYFDLLDGVLIQGMHFVQSIFHLLVLPLIWLLQ